MIQRLKYLIAGELVIVVILCSFAINKKNSDLEVYSEYIQSNEVKWLDMEIESTKTKPTESELIVSKRLKSETINSEYAELDQENITAEAESPNQAQTNLTNTSSENKDSQTDQSKKDFIKWVDFSVSYEALNKAYQYDVETHESDIKLSWIELLAFLGVKYGGDFKKYKEKDLNALVESLKNKTETMESLTEKMDYYNYYYEAYEAVLGGLVGEYEIEMPNESQSDEKVWIKKYGLKAFLPIAKGFPYNDYDDFGVSRSYGYKRRHLGHDMMGQVGTPIIAVESGYVEVLGWNRYGGWRIGIRSFDKKRYYYYAHLRKNYPFHKSLKEGSIVQAGDVIGYLGRTGYSTTENTNNIATSHLHIGLQLIFDESQKEGASEIWVDCYNLVRFLYQNRSETIKNVETKEYNRVFEIKDPTIHNN